MALSPAFFGGDGGARKCDLRGIWHLVYTLYTRGDLIVRSLIAYLFSTRCWPCVGAVLPTDFIVAIICSGSYTLDIGA